MPNSSLFVLPLIGAPSSFVLIRPYSCLIGYPGIKTSVKNLKRTQKGREQPLKAREQDLMRFLSRQGEAV